MDTEPGSIPQALWDPYRYIAKPHMLFSHPFLPVRLPGNNFQGSRVHPHEQLHEHRFVNTHSKCIGTNNNPGFIFYPLFLFGISFFLC